MNGRWVTLIAGALLAHAISANAAFWDRPIEVDEFRDPSIMQAFLQSGKFNFVSIARASMGHSYPVRDKFETDEQFAARRAADPPFHLYGKLMSNSKLAITGQFIADISLPAGMSLLYDPGRGVANLCREAKFVPYSTFDVYRNEQKGRSFIGENAFGVKRSITRVKQFVVTVQTNLGLGRDGCFPDIEIPPEEAGQQLRAAYWVIFGTLDGPARAAADLVKATIDNPFEIDRTTVTIEFKATEVMLIGFPPKGSRPFIAGWAVSP